MGQRGRIVPMKEGYDDGLSKCGVNGGGKWGLSR